MNQLPASFSFWIYSVLKSLRLIIDQETLLKKVILSSNKSPTWVCVVLRKCQPSSMFLFRSFLLPLKTCSPKKLFYFYLQCLLVNVRHTGACPERFLNDWSELCPLKQEYPLILSHMSSLSSSSAWRAIILVCSEEKLWVQVLMSLKLTKVYVNTCFPLSVHGISEL